MYDSLEQHQLGGVSQSLPTAARSQPRVFSQRLPSDGEAAIHRASDPRCTAGRQRTWEEKNTTIAR